MRWREDFYTELASSDDVLLIIEVADSTVADDRHRRLPLYAAGGIPEAWLVDLPAGLIEIHSQPGPHSYALIRLVGPGEHLAPAALPDVEIEAGVVLS